MSERISRARLALFIAICLMSTASGCKNEKLPTGGTTSSGTVRATDPHKLTDAEFKFGMSPTRNPEVTYQKDVVLMEHGAEAVRSMSSNGLEWTLDANAPGAADVREGKILFATNRVVGRVLGVVRKGNEMKVVLGPVTLTDVIKRANLSYDQPVDLNSMIAYAAPDYPGADGDTTPVVRVGAAPRRERTTVSFANLKANGDVLPMRMQTRAHGYRITSTILTNTDRERFRAMRVVRRGAPGVQQVPGAPQIPGVPQVPGLPQLTRAPTPPPSPTIGPPSEVSIGDFRTQPFCCGGLGMKITHQDAAMTISAYAVLRLSSPSIHFDLKIGDDGVETAAVELRGAAGLSVQFDAHSEAGLEGNIKRQFYVPVDLSIPITGLAAPLAVTVRQTFLLETAFSAKQSNLSAGADYQFKGSVSMGYRNGSWGAGAPEQLSTQRTLAQSISGGSVGVNGLVFGYGGRVIVGIGAFGFVTGPYVGYNTSVGITRDTDLDVLTGRVCGASNLYVLLKFGIGYSIPQPVTSAINTILRALNLKQIEGSGGLGSEKPIVNKNEVWPSSCPRP